MEQFDYYLLMGILFEARIQWNDQSSTRGRAVMVVGGMVSDLSGCINPSELSSLNKILRPFSQGTGMIIHGAMDWNPGNPGVFSETLVG